MDAGQTLWDSDQDICDIVVMRHAPIEPLPYVQCVVVVLKPTIRPITVVRHIMNLHCTILYGQRWLTIGCILWASGGQAGLQGVAMIYGLACVWNCHHNTRSSLGVGHP